MDVWHGQDLEGSSWNTDAGMTVPYQSWNAPTDQNAWQ